MSACWGASLPHADNASAVAIAQIAHHGLWESEAGEAVFFHARYVRPGWSLTKARLAQIDKHIFYR
jgi:spore germination cell wall hydrolase CwlJ-like protein